MANDELATRDDQVTEWAAKFMEAARAPSTKRAYAEDWRQFERWCDHYGVASLPASPDTMVAYLVALARAALPWEREAPVTRTVGTIRRKLCSIAMRHETARGPSGESLPNPVAHRDVKSTWEGIRRTLGCAQSRKRPVDAMDLERYVAGLGPGLLHRRDAALLSVGFGAALRRSELVALDVEDVAFSPRGLLVTITHSKTDQYGFGRQVPVPAATGHASCPASCLRAWLSAAKITTGAIFRPVFAGKYLGTGRLTDESVALRVKAFAEAMGLDPKLFAGHSLRAGFVTAAYEGDADLTAIMDVTGHQSFDMVKRYIREVDMWKDPAGAKIKRR